MIFFTHFYDSPALSFLILGLVLLVFELLGTAGYLLWCGIAALCVGLLNLILPITFFASWVIFSLLALISAYLWWYWLRKRGGDKTEGTRVNRRDLDLVGVETVVVSTFIQGQGRVKINDGSWRAVCDQDLQLGEKVTVVAVNNVTLVVTPTASKTKP